MTYAWEKTIAAFLRRQPERCTSLEIFMGRGHAGADTPIAVFDLAIPYETSAPEIAEFLADIHSTETTSRVYTLRTRRSDGQSQGTHCVNVAAASPKEAKALSIDPVAFLAKQNHELHCQLLDSAKTQHESYKVLLLSNIEANKILSEDNISLRKQLKDAQELAGDAIKKLEETEAEIGELGKNEKRLARLLRMLLADIDKRTDGAATKALGGDAAKVMQAVVSEVATQVANSNGRATEKTAPKDPNGN